MGTAGGGGGGGGGAGGIGLQVGAEKEVQAGFWFIFSIHVNPSQKNAAGVPSAAAVAAKLASALFAFEMAGHFSCCSWCLLQMSLCFAYGAISTFN